LGDFTVYVGASTGWQPVNGRYIQFHPDGEIVDTLQQALLLPIPASCCWALPAER
jgi:hypothetical protein